MALLASHSSTVLSLTKPDYTMELTINGLIQADLAGIELKQFLGHENVFFYVSPYWRTQMTFEEISKHFDKLKITYREEPRLREQEFGHFRSIDECDKANNERDQFGTFYYRMQDGEIAADVYDRVSDFFGTLHRDFEKDSFPNNAVIVTHGMTIRLFLMRWFHWTVEQFEAYANPYNCEVFIREKSPEGKYFLQTELRKRNL